RGTRRCRNRWHRCWCARRCLYWRRKERIPRATDRRWGGRSYRTGHPRSRSGPSQQPETPNRLTRGGWSTAAVRAKLAKNTRGEVIWRCFFAYYSCEFFFWVVEFLHFYQEAERGEYIPGGTTAFRSSKGRH